MRWPIVLLLATTVLACSSGSLQAPPPKLPPSGEIPAAPPSVLRVPVEVDLAALSEKLHEVLPGSVEGTIARRLVPQLAFDVAYRIDVGTLQLHAFGDQLEATVEFDYDASVCTRPGFAPCVRVLHCRGKERPRVRVTAKSAISFSEAWSLQTDTKFLFEHLRPCEITPLDLDMGPLVEDVMRPELERLSRRLDQEIPIKSDVECAVDAIWERLHQPVPLGAHAWVKIRPVALEASPFDGDGDTLRVGIGLLARPEVLAGKRPAPTPPTPLPPLRIESFDPRFSLVVTARAPLDKINERLRERLRGKEFKAGPYPVKFRDVELRAAEGSDAPAFRLELEIERPILWNVRATIWATGRIDTDPKTRELRVHSLDYSLESNSLLLGAANWMLGNRFKTRLQSELSEGLRGKVEDLETLLGHKLDGPIAPGVVLDLDVSEIRPLFAVATEDALVVRVRVLGRSNVEVAPLLTVAPREQNREPERNQAREPRQQQQPEGHPTVSSLCERLRR